MRGVSKKKAVKARPTSGYAIHRKYADPLCVKSAAQLRTSLQKDMQKLRDRLSFFGNDEDREAFDALAGAVNELAEAGAGEVDMLADPHSGVRYRVRVEAL